MLLTRKGCCGRFNSVITNLDLEHDAPVDGEHHRLALRFLGQIRRTTMETFAQKFMKIYDRKILSGETTFSRSGIDRNDFTRLCIDGEYVFSKEALDRIREKMPLTDEEYADLLAFID